MTNRIPEVAAAPQGIGRLCEDTSTPATRITGVGEGDGAPARPTNTTPPVIPARASVAAPAPMATRIGRRMRPSTLQGAGGSGSPRQMRGFARQRTLRASAEESPESPASATQTLTWSDACWQRASEVASSTASLLATNRISASLDPVHVTIGVGPYQPECPPTD